MRPRGRASTSTAVRPRAEQRAKSSIAALGRRLVVLALPIAASCASPTEVAPSRTLIFAPSRTSATLSLENPGDRPLPLTRIRLDPQSPDWGSFVITDRETPRELPAHGRAELHLSVDLEHFVSDHAPGQPVRYRRGQARLLAQVDGAPLTVPLRFEPQQEGALALALAKAGIVGLLLGLVVVTLRRGRPLGAAPWLLGVTLALLPWGPGVCFSGLGAALGPADLEQCAAGFGGTPLAWLHPDAGLLVWLAALLVLDLAAWARAPRASAPATALRLGSRRLVLDVVLVLAVASVALAPGSVDLGAIAAAPGLLRLPIAALLVVFAQALRRATVGAGVPEDLDRAAFAGMLTALFLGGGTLPAGVVHGVAHGAAVALAALVFLLKGAVLWWLLRALDRWRARARPWASPRVLVGLVLAALVHLVVVAVTRSGGP